MTGDRDTEPTRTREPMDPAPDSRHPTTAMLKADIDSGETGEKIGVFDPALAPLGTDDEAAGRPPSAMRVALARRYETFGRWIQGGRAGGHVHEPPGAALTGFVAFIATVAVIFVVGLSVF
jgi:hypothetical protein